MDVKHSKPQDDFYGLVSLYLANEPFLGKRSLEEKASGVILSFPLCPAFLVDAKWKDRLQDTEFYLVWGVEGEELGLMAEGVDFRGDLYLVVKSPWGSRRKKDQDSWCGLRGWLGSFS